MFDISGCNKVGKRISNEIISVLEEPMELKSEIEFKHKVLRMDLPLRKATKADYEKSVREMEYFVQKNADKPVFNYADNAKMYVYAGNIRRFRLQQTTETFTIESHVIRFGDVAFSTNPSSFSLTTETASRREAMRSRPLLFSFLAAGAAIFRQPRRRPRDITALTSQAATWVMRAETSLFEKLSRRSTRCLRVRKFTLSKAFAHSDLTRTPRLFYHR